MRKFRDMTGERCGEWLVLRQAPGYVSGQDRRWVCRCSCGAEVTVKGESLKSGGSTRCRKCADKTRSERMRENPPSLTHGRSEDPVYWVWKLMKHRCFNKRSKAYKDYGGRGVTMCRRWAESFEHFIADMGERPPGMTIERKDNDGPYAPGNCKWIPKAEQRSNTRHTHRITYKGVTKPLLHWARDLGITNNALMYRLRKWGIARAVTTPASENGKKAGRASVAKRGRFAMIKAAQARWKHTPKTTINPEKFKP